MNKKYSLINSIRLWGIILIFITSFSLLLIDTIESFTSVSTISEQVKNIYLQKQKEIVKQEVKQTVELIKLKHNQIIKLAKNKIKNRVEKAIKLADTIYKKYSSEKSLTEIKSLILTALKGLDYKTDSGYYFVGTTSGKVLLLPLVPQLENTNQINLKTKRGVFITKQFIKTAKEKGEGFEEYLWKKTPSSEYSHKKITYVKLYKPFNWIIGTGIYAEDIQKEIEDELLTIISNIRFGVEGYIFVNKFDGTAIISNGKRVHGNKKLWEVFTHDTLNTKHIYEMSVNAAKKPEGGFIYYNIVKLSDSSKVYPKTSFIYGLPEFDWYIGSGFYNDDFQNEIAVVKNSLSKSIYIKIAITLFSFLVIVIIFLFLNKKISKKFQSDISIFISFLKKAVGEKTRIEKNKLQFSEFDEISEYANSMISENILAEQALINEREKISVTIQSIGEAIISTDLDGNLHLMNGAAEKLIGWNFEEAKLKHIDEIVNLVDTNTQKPILHLTKEVLKENRSIKQKKSLTLISRNGKKYFVKSTAAPIKNYKSETIGLVFVYRDVTTDEKLKLKLEESNIHYQKLFNNSPVPLWEEDLTELFNYFDELKSKGVSDFRKYFNNNEIEVLKCTKKIKIVNVNQTSVRFYEAKSKKHLISNFEQIFTDKSLQTFKEEIISSAEGNLSFTSEAEIKTLTGKIKKIFLKMQLDKTNRKKIIGFLATTDITDLKKTKEKLLQSEEKFKTLVEYSPIGIFLNDINGKAIYVNKKCAEIIGVPQENALDFNWTSFLHPDDCNWVLEKWQYAFKNGIKFSEKYRWLHPEDKIVWTHGQIVPVKNEDGKIVLYIGTLTDITKQIEAEKKLIASKEKLETLFSSMTEMVVFYDFVFNENNEVCNYRLVECNEAFTKITGIPRDEAIGKLATEVYEYEQAPYLDEFKRVVETGKPFEYTTYSAPLDKHFIISVVTPKVNQIATIITEITTIKQFQDLITEKNKELETYLYVASHDLRTPLVNIQGFSMEFSELANSIKEILFEENLSETTRKQVEKIIDKKIPDNLKYIFAGVSKMDRLIKGLLQISRTGRVQMRIRQINMNELIKNVLNIFNYQISEINANIIVQKLPDCFGDYDLLNQLFSNLIGNAIKYRKENEKLEIRISGKEHYQYSIYTISDNGIGIAERHKRKIWEVFFQVNLKQSNEGEGIGLSIVKRIIEKHKGKIHLESQKDVGTTFRIELQKNMFEI